MREQEQFLQVLDRDEAERRFRAAIDPSPRGVERIPIDAALGRVLSSDVVSPVDVPSFDRSNVDGLPSSPKTPSAPPKNRRAWCAWAARRFIPAWSRRPSSVPARRCRLRQEG